MGFQSLDISFESAVYRRLKEDLYAVPRSFCRLLSSPPRASHFKSNAAEQRRNWTYLINPVHPPFPSRLTILRRGIRQRPRNLLDYDPHKIGLWLPSDPDVVFAGVDEDDIHIECREEAIERCNVACKGRSLLEREGVRMGKYAPERHFDGDSLKRRNTILKDVVSLPFLAVNAT
jgi:hypothetical protein